MNVELVDSAPPSGADEVAVEARKRVHASQETGRQTVRHRLNSDHQAGDRISAKRTRPQTATHLRGGIVERHRATLFQ
jgi:hypothetical protein